MQQPQFLTQAQQVYNVYVNPYGMRRLAPNFTPGNYDVLCARGKLAFDHEGNRRFRALVKQNQKQYSAAGCKYEKSKIVSFIVAAVRNASPMGGFVKNIDGAWYEVGDRHAKEKVGQTFRDLLHTKYSSSTKAKARARVQKRIKGDPDQMDEDEPKSQPHKTKKETKPEAVPSRSPISAGDLRSSVSVVSANSMETEEAQNVTRTRTRTMTTPRKTTKKLPPMINVVVKQEPQWQGPSSQLVTPPQSHCVASVNGEMMNSFLRSSIQTFDGRDSTTNNNNGPQGMHVPSHYATPLRDSTSSAGSMDITFSDMEPLPLGQTPTVTVDFNESSTSLQSEQSFEEVMSEFCQNMSGVPV